jgi:hypothetical protein
MAANLICSAHIGHDLNSGSDFIKLLCIASSEDSGYSLFLTGLWVNDVPEQLGQNDLRIGTGDSHLSQVLIEVLLRLVSSIPL